MSGARPSSEDGPWQVLDPRFGACIVPGAAVERLWTGGIWTEGPAWLPDARCLVWSDIPNDRMLRWSADTGVTPYRQPSNGANGNTVDGEGRLVTCEQSTRRIIRTEHDGRTTVLANRFEGRRFNAPNDVVVKADGTIWFTDPDYGRSARYEGDRELTGCHVYRLDPQSGHLAQMTTDFVMPNGLAFSPDESMLYVVDTGSTHQKEGPNHIRRFTVADGALSGGEVVLASANEGLDGLRIDHDGRLWCAAEDGVHCHGPDGACLGTLRLPERAGNLCFGGPALDELFICGSTSLYRCRVAIRGASRPPARGDD